MTVPFPRAVPTENPWDLTLAERERIDRGGLRWKDSGDDPHVLRRSER